MAIFDIFLSQESREEIKKAKEFGELAPKIIQKGISELKGFSEILDQAMSHPDYLLCCLVVAIYASDNANQRDISPIRKRLLDTMIHSCEHIYPHMRTKCLEHFDFLGRRCEQFKACGLPFDGDAIKTASGIWILSSLGYTKESEFNPLEQDELVEIARNLGGYLYIIFMSYWEFHKYLLLDKDNG